MASADLHHSIRTVSRLTGLSPHVIRVWEKRYSTVQPQRTPGNQRLYSGADIERLTRLKKLTDSGYSIGRLAGVGDKELAELCSQEAATPHSESRAVPEPKIEFSSQGWVELGLDAVRNLDAVALEDVLERATFALGQIGLLTQLIGPLAERIGDEWRVGKLQIAHEHLATATLRTFVGQMIRPIAVHNAAPLLVAATPAGQLHELGAVLVAGAAASLGWRVTYLGAALPAEEIARAALAGNARVVALSLVHPDDDPDVPQELRRMRRLLPMSTVILAGGRAAPAYRTALEEIGAHSTACFEELSDLLESHRSGKSKAVSMTG